MSEQNAQDLQAVELSIGQAKASIARKDALIRLENNPDFKELIAKGFLEQHAVRQVLLKAHPGYQDEANQKTFDDQITAIGNFKQYLVNIFTMGMQAAQALDNDEKTREELLAEDLD